MHRTFLILGSLFGFLGVAAGAFGAHALREIVAPQYLMTFETAARYQMYHAFAILVSGWAVARSHDTYFYFAGWVFTAGILLFSGSLYILSLTGIRWLGAITPFGGVLFLAGWLLLVIGFWANREEAS
jgi:uncharacterized membrane protein YgdD (TMEM256/DUF423 family)